MMRLRGFGRGSTKGAPEDATDDLELDSLTAPSKEDRMSEKPEVQEEQGNWGFQVCLILVLCLMLGTTQYLLRSDNTELKAVAAVIRDFQAREAQALKLIPSSAKPKDDSTLKCETELIKVKDHLAELRASTRATEDKIKEVNTGCLKTMDRLKELIAEKDKMEAQINDLEKEKQALAKKLGILAEGAI